MELGSPRGQAESLPLLGRKQRSESVEEGLAVRQSCPEAAEPCHKGEVCVCHRRPPARPAAPAPRWSLLTAHSSDEKLVASLSIAGPLSVVGAALVVFAVLVATQLVAVPLLCRRFGGGSSGTPPQYPQFLVVSEPVSPVVQLHLLLGQGLQVASHPLHLPQGRA